VQKSGAKFNVLPTLAKKGWGVGRGEATFGGLSGWLYGWLIERLIER
jgi:hypothetical protein